MINRRFKLFSLALMGILISIGSISATAADNAKERPKPKVYPYSSPFDEPHCPSGKCSRANENPAHTKKKGRFEQDVDED